MSKSTLDSLGPDDTARLKSFMDAAIRIFQEIEDLKGGLNDTAKALAEHLNVKPAILKKAARVAFKNNAAEEKESSDTVLDIVNVTGHG